MRISMIVEDYPPGSGGGGIAAQELSKRLVKKHEIVVLTQEKEHSSKEYEEHGITIFRTGKNKIMFFFFALIKLLRMKNVDIYHAHGTYCGLIAKIASLFTKKPVILHLHGYREAEINMIKHLAQNFIIKLGFTAIISVDKYGAEKAISLGARKTSVFHINGGVELEKFRNSKKEKSDRTVFLFVGRLTKIKNPDMLLRAMAEIEKNNVELRIAGDGEMEGKLKQLAETLELKNVKFLGRITSEKLPELYSSASFLVLPSETEGQPLVVLEALASGLPLILSDIAPLKEILNESNAGFCFKTKDQLELTKAMKNAIDLNAKEYKKLSQNARNYSEKFSWEKTIDRINRIYSVF